MENASKTDQNSDAINDLAAHWKNSLAPELYQEAQLKISTALANFDSAPIFTIDGFFQRLLKEFAFQANTLFSVDLDTDEKSLIDTALRDYWRQYVYNLDDVELNIWMQHIQFDQALEFVNEALQKPQATFSPYYDSSRDDLAVGIHAENGVIYIRAVNGDLVLQGKNVKIDANDPQGTVSINANKEIYTQAPKFQAQTTNFTVGSKKNFHIFAGDVKLHSEYVPAELSTGDDYVLNDSLSSKALNVSDIWKDASIWS